MSEFQFQSNISFNKTFEQSSNINFAPDVPIQVVYVSFEGTLRKPILSIQLNRVHTGSFVAALNKPSMNVSLVRVHSSTINASLSKPRSTFLCMYDNNVFRGIVSEIDTEHKDAKNLEVIAILSTYRDTKALDALTLSNWKGCRELNSDFKSSLSNLLTIEKEVQFTHKEAIKSYFALSIVIDQTLPISLSNTLEWKEGKEIMNDLRITSDQCLNAHTLFKTQWQDAQTLNKEIMASSKEGKELGVNYDTRWKEAINRHGLSWIILEPSIEPIDDIYDSNIIFIDPFLFDSKIVFGMRRQAIKTITARNYYFMLHEIQVQRVVGNKAIHVSNITINTDVDSWRMASHC